MRSVRRVSSFFGVFVYVSFFWMCLSLLGIMGLKKQRRALQIFTFRHVLKIWHIKLTIEGTPAPAPALWVANHCSYLDVGIIGAIDSVRFTPKSEVRRWPVIGQMVQAFDVIFVDRTPSKSKKAQQDLLAALRGGDRICVFPEGTTNDGQNLKPFKPTLFSLAEQWDGDTPLAVQPIAIAYRCADGAPITAAQWPHIAWFGDQYLISHLWIFSGFKRIDVVVHCLPPLHLGEHYEHRKALAQAAYDSIAQHMS
ncbi:MAG: 1-acyl-sn-glycerol-3-phosphate acyltransferase [Alphaproteobacteria bacterium]|nr:MAG: 1-acyl-sn-glycerol-3-phosphate acyltransferase [Alphaproteobacteria bacterium]TAF16067.1 MAG: 1-acyl-sn-glycerol-3-phosphate acyltransferase [Alphaproteobacteria bacterium]TAF75925.1 MAG: 1-acyl-sn-glycerol-3-phosphate acyltransferase [Alphaproteobacteria bacterium]